MLAWFKAPPGFLRREYDIIELFAGKARICRVAEAKGFFALAHDFAYHKPSSGRNNCMDINGKAGYVLFGFSYEDLSCFI